MGWRDIPGWPGYQVSNDGQVKSLPRVVFHPRGGERRVRGGMLTPSLSAGYPAVYLSRGGVKTTIRIHVLVALVWIGPRPDGYDVSHKDEDKTNNHVSNLCYLSYSQHRRNDKGVPVIRSDGRYFDSVAEAAECMGCSSTNIRQVCRGRNKFAGDYGWSYWRGQTE